MDEPCDLPEGTVVDLVIDDAGDDLDDEERAALHESLDAGWESLKRGEPGIPAEVVIAKLRSKR